MGIRNWHRSKIALLWLAYFLVVLISWAANVEINESYVHLLSAPLALLWLLIFIPLFAITWRWTTGLQKASDFTHGEPLAQVSTLDLPTSTRFYAISYRKIVWVIAVAMVGAAGGYWYKDFESHSFSDKWIVIQDSPEDLPSRIRFSPDHKESLRASGNEISIENVETKVKFATARFNRTEDAELLYRGSLKTYLSTINLENDHPKTPTLCEYYLVFELYDIDHMFLVGLVGPRDTVGLEQEKKIEGVIEEVIPRQMARRTATIKRQVILDKCT